MATALAKTRRQIRSVPEPLRAPPPDGDGRRRSNRSRSRVPTLGVSVSGSACFRRPAPLGPAALDFAAGPIHQVRWRISSLSTACCYSWFLTASGLACFSVPSRITVLVPAAEGKPSALLTSGSITDEKDPPQPFTPGAANELSTSEL